MRIHSFRSRDQDFKKCERRGYLTYAFGGRGIVKRAKNIFLSTGIWTHKGLADVLLWCKNHAHANIPEEVLDHICRETKLAYFNDVFPKEAILNSGKELVGFDLNDERWDEWEEAPRELNALERQKAQRYTIDEQMALVEAFIRVFVIKVLSIWLKRFRIVMVEKDMSFPFVEKDGIEIVQSATIDAVLQEIETKDIYLVSYKTAGRYDKRTAKAAEHDQQGISETWAFEEFLRREKGLDKKVMGVQMLYFVKGDRREIEDTGVWGTRSPLIKGYRRIGLSDVEYAHSYWFPKPENKSGKGMLGRDWEEFNVWTEQEMGGVKGWINLLAGGTVQPDCGDILSKCLVYPNPYFRQDREVKRWRVQQVNEELRRAKKLVQIRGIGEEKGLDALFPQNRDACHYPGDCSYLNVCHGTEEERGGVMEEFEQRVPHHRGEREEG